MTRPREVSQLTTAKLETARRLLRANLGMITPRLPPRTCRSWRTCRQSMPSWPDAPSAWQPGGSQHYDSGMLPARLLPSARRAGIAVCTNPGTPGT